MANISTGDDMIKNRLKHWRHKFEMDQTEFALFLELDRTHYNRMEKHPEKHNPNTETMCRIWLKIKERFPDCHLEDMWEFTETT